MTAVRYPALGYNESVELNIRPNDESRVQVLLPFIQYGPDYLRGVFGNLRDYSLFVGRQDLEAAERYLANAEAIVAHRLDVRS